MGGVPPPPGAGGSRSISRGTRPVSHPSQGSASSTTLPFVHRRPHGVAGAAGGRAARKGGTPGEGPPFDPLLRFVSTRGVPRAAARGQGSAPGPRPLFCKKAGQKTFIPRCPHGRRGISRVLNMLRPRLPSSSRRGRRRDRCRPAAPARRACSGSKHRPAPSSSARRPRRRTTWS